jgi:glycosyltransferase involved in cell wall biosynthesis
VARKDVYVTGLRGIPGVIGGVESHCEELLPRIAALAPELQITVLGRRGFVSRPPAEYEGVKVIALAAPKGTHTEAIGGTAAAVFHAWRRGADLIHIHAIGPSLFAPLARCLGMRVLVTHHGRDYDRAKWGRFAKSMLRLGERLAVSCSHQLIAVAPTLARQLRQAFPRRAPYIHYIPNGAPALEGTLTADEVLEQFGLTPRSYVLAVGRLVPEKGFDYLIRAFRSSGTDRSLVIVGSAIHDSDFHRSLIAQTDEQVQFIGNQPRAVLRRLYEQADLFVLPSFHEGLAISALEAVECGTPLLLSDIPPNKDLGLGASNYFPVGDEAALAIELARPGSSFAYDVDEIRSHFNWDSIARQTLAIYRDLLFAGRSAEATAPSSS